jgi:hypothetical protein
MAHTAVTNALSNSAVEIHTAVLRPHGFIHVNPMTITADATAHAADNDTAGIPIWCRPFQADEAANVPTAVYSAHNRAIGHGII